jgi:hypothetical protein
MIIWIYRNCVMLSWSVEVTPPLSINPTIWVVVQPLLFASVTNVKEAMMSRQGRTRTAEWCRYFLISLFIRSKAILKFIHLVWLSCKMLILNDCRTGRVKLISLSSTCLCPLLLIWRGSVSCCLLCASVSELGRYDFTPVAGAFPYLSSPDIFVAISAQPLTYTRDWFKANSIKLQCLRMRERRTEQSNWLLVGIPSKLQLFYDETKWIY